MSFAVHHVLMPFIPEKTIEDADSDGASTMLEIEEERSQLKDRKTLHQLERWSIFLCLSVVWSSTVFILYSNSTGQHCSQISCSLLAAGVVVTNVLFLCGGISLFYSSFYQAES